MSETAEAHWERVKDHCQARRDYDPDCIEAWYAALEEENELEWWIMLKQWFFQQPGIALFGNYYATYAFLSALYFMIWPDRIPSIEDAPWEDIGLIRGLMIMSVSITAN